MHVCGEPNIKWIAFRTIALPEIQHELGLAHVLRG
jgi:hypothetical protein